jgi:hypothetical protein
VPKIEPSANGEVRFTLTGRVGSAHVAELQRLDVKVVDRAAVSFLARCEWQPQQESSKDPRNPRPDAAPGHMRRSSR